MKKALIHNGVVQNTYEETFEVHPDMIWVDCPDDVEPLDLYDGSTFSSPPSEEVSAEDKLEELRYQRNILLQETDYWGLSDQPAMTQPQIDYRQALRDITNTYQDVESVVWPDKP